jgi:hypothetical protein
MDGCKAQSANPVRRALKGKVPRITSASYSRGVMASHSRVQRRSSTGVDEIEKSENRKDTIEIV